MLCSSQYGWVDQWRQRSPWRSPGRQCGDDDAIVWDEGGEETLLSPAACSQAWWDSYCLSRPGLALRSNCFPAWKQWILSVRWKHCNLPWSPSSQWRKKPASFGWVGVSLGLPYVLTVHHNPERQYSPHLAHSQTWSICWNVDLMSSSAYTRQDILCIFEKYLMQIHIIFNKNKYNSLG